MLQQFIADKNYLNKLSIPAEKSANIAHLIALQAKPAITKNIILPKQILTNPHDTELIKALWDKTGTSLTAGYLLFNELVRRNISDKTQTSITVQDHTNFIAFNNNSTQVAIGAVHDNNVMLYDLTTKSIILTLQNPYKITALSWSSRGELAVAGEDNIIYLWNTATGEKIRQIEGHSGAITSLAWSPDGMRLASGSEDKTVRLWSYHGQKIIQKHQTMVRKVLWSSDGANVFSCSKEIYAWNIHEEKNIFSYATEYVFGSMSLDPANSLLATVNDNDEVYIIDISSNNCYSP